MKKFFISACFFALTATNMSAGVQVKETLNRAPVAVKTSQGILVSWRYLAADGDVMFTVYRNGEKVADDISDVTNYLDADGNSGDIYKVVSSKGDEASCEAWESIFKKISITRPAARKDKNGSTTGRYRPDGCSVADVDGDGDYELIVKWLPDNSRDSGKDGYASPAYLDCYEFDGTQKWRIDIGHCIRSGQHTSPFIVYDMDGDGKAELITKTGPDTKDGKGVYATQAATDNAIKGIDPNSVTVNSKGRVTAGAELLTVFNGETGAAMHTIWYSPNRAMVDFPSADGAYSSSWGDGTYNRGERYNAAVAYLDGQNSLPTAILQRGYYTACYIWAVDWNGSELKTRWLHKGSSKTSWSVVDATGKTLFSGSGKSSYGQGVHGISIGDVNIDGYDDIVTGGATIGHDGQLLCSTGKGHGDAIHLTDLCPDRPGLEVMMPHEDSPYGYDVHDATTGELLASATGTGDNGRGLAADFIPANRGFEFWSSQDNNTYDCATNKVVLTKKADTSFRIYWTGDPYDQTFDGRYDSGTGVCSPRIRAYNTASKGITTCMEFAAYGKPQTVNTTKANPCLQADILGDWREEIIMTGYEADWSAPTCDLLIYSTPEPTKFKIPCLMEDHIYRMGIVWQNSSYNQPPHLGYYLPDNLGIDGTTYQTNVTNHAPEVLPATDGSEALKEPAEDKGTTVGTCYTAGMEGELTNALSNGYLKVRTGNANNTITFNVNPGYVITKMYIEGYSNNTSTTADRSITMTSITVDGTDIAESSLVFPGGTAGQTPVSRTYSNMGSKQNVVLNFDNSNITTSDIDSKGKNKQIMVKITFTYEQVQTGISEVVSETVSVDAVYNLAGQRVSENTKGIVIKNGKKIFVK
ncbi:MAG: rhamnogalacturonan lyase [Bacteroidales bacterium]|nr:rhamnogalacturonan lyase [Bacteroidales bacterium]MCM1147599.1 rhamnogalacturonan lyase [Bacteroidales bacterium]MCM1206389.1 rhamnogalacturonan lyase [Bacillota bacterium]MCM1509123.1 hypothetical protein [Clostridium sp.]